MSTPAVGDLFGSLAEPELGEVFEDLLRVGVVRIERIISSPCPEDTLYDQDDDEWVLLVRGEARLSLEDEEVRLRAGEYLFIPAHTRHRVLSTSDSPRCLWLAIHVSRPG